MAEYQDFPRDELVAEANRILAESDGKADVHFKATCPRCGERCMFAEPNRTFETMECCKCGKVFPFVKGNYMIEMHFDR